MQIEMHSPTDAGPEDPLYDKPWIAVDEARDAPVPHRYVHGGFEGTQARFSFYFAPAERYRGRFFHNTYPLQQGSDIADLPNGYRVGVGNLRFAIDSGAYYVQTNLGGRSHESGGSDPTIVAFRVNAAAARYSRRLAAAIFGPHRAWGYLYGGSGGAYQAVGSAENTRGVWDGYMPFLMGTEHSVPSSFTVIQHALRVLRRRNKVPAIARAISGGEDPCIGLDDEERAALREATLCGFPLQGWRDSGAIARDFFPNLAPFIPKLDPGYNADFWSKPGYLGADPGASIHADRFQFDTRVADVIRDFPRRFVLAAMPERDFDNAHLVLLQGPHAGSSIPIRDRDRACNAIGFALYADQVLIDSVQPGDPVRIDNAWALAMETYHRHQVPPASEGLYAWDHYRDGNGKLAYPQRERLIGPSIARRFAGAPMTGAISSRMLMLQGLVDIDLHPWQADWYRGRVRDALGSSAPQRFALRFIESGGHDNPSSPASQAQTVSLDGHIEQALHDLVSWVENGMPPHETHYHVADTQIVLPGDAQARGGIQAVIRLTIEGPAASEVAAGAAVTFQARIEVPEGTGSVIAIDWDFEGQGDFSLRHAISTPLPLMEVSTSHVYTTPGIRFAIVRATSHRHADIRAEHGRVENLARVRVTVR